jgi:hypothetical protein
MRASSYCLEYEQGILLSGILLSGTFLSGILLSGTLLSGTLPFEIHTWEIVRFGYFCGSPISRKSRIVSRETFVLFSKRSRQSQRSRQES